MPDRSEKPIGYASCTLTITTRNWKMRAWPASLELKKFHDYLFGHAFELMTDHTPPLGLFKEDCASSPQASTQIKCWSLFLSGYEYTLVFQNTKTYANADTLSMLPQPIEPATTEQVPELVLLAQHLADSPVTADDIRTWTRRDPKLGRDLQYLQQGWLSEVRFGTVLFNLNSQPTKDASYGKSEYCPTAWKRSHATRAARRSPRDHKNKIVGLNVCVVAWKQC